MDQYDTDTFQSLQVKVNEASSKLDDAFMDFKREPNCEINRNRLWTCMAEYRRASKALDEKNGKYKDQQNRLIFS